MKKILTLAFFMLFSFTCFGQSRSIITDPSNNSRMARVGANGAMRVECVAGCTGGGGDASAANQTTIIGHIDGVETLLAGVLKSAPWAGGTLASGTTAAITDTTSTQVITGTASNYIYITQCTVANAHVSVSTGVNLQDGSGGAVLYNIPAAFGYGGATLTFPVPLKVPTVSNGLFAAPVVTGSSIKVSCSGFKSTVSY